MTPLVHWIVCFVLSLPGIALMIAAIFGHRFFRKRHWERWDIAGGPAFDSGGSAAIGAFGGLLRAAHAKGGEAGARTLVMLLGLAYIVVVYWGLGYLRG
jgi:hypothetical protein